jgi:hypothetical protein
MLRASFKYLIDHKLLTIKQGMNEIFFHLKLIMIRKIMNII